MALWHVRGLGVVARRAVKPRRFATVLALIFLLAPNANAHPHVWVVMRAEILFALDGSITAMRHTWAFDESLSASVARELGSTAPTREALAQLAQVNIDALKESGFFIRSRADGEDQKFQAPEDYWLAFEEGTLTLHFTLPFESPVNPARLELGIYDPSYFTDIKLAENTPVVLVGAPKRCRLFLERQSWTQISNKVIVFCR
jgi:ABC-type uncharacterized transport system substrate-binding protein